MATKPSTIPTWATNTNFAASSQPWASSPTKVQPASGVQAEGHNPEDPTVAQYENWFKNLVGQWCDWVNKISFNTKVRHIPAMTGLQIDTGTAMTRDVTYDYWFTSAATNVFRIPIALV